MRGQLYTYLVHSELCKCESPSIGNCAVVSTSEDTCFLVVCVAGLVPVGGSGGARD